MSTRRNLLFVAAWILAAPLLVGCGGGNGDSTVSYACPMNCEGDKAYPEPGSCPVCGMALAAANAADAGRIPATGDIPDASIFNLDSAWTDQDGRTLRLAELRGEVLVVVMIYTSCQAACPRLVADVRNIDAAVGDESLHKVFVSIDPETDTPARLKEFAIANRMVGSRWTFLQGSLDDVREFANVLAVRYRRITPLDFSHSNIISVFDREGELHYQQEGLGVDNSAIVAKVRDLLR